MDHRNRAALTTLPSPPFLPVELFGVPRLLAGERAVMARGETLAALAADLVRRQPALAGRVLAAETGWPLDGYCFVVDERFTREPAEPIGARTSVILVASAAGG